MSDKAKSVTLRPVQFVQAPAPPAPYESFDQMDIVTLRDYIRAKGLMRGYLPTIIHKDPAVALCNGTMNKRDVARWEWEHIVKKRGMMTDGKLRQWVKKHERSLLAELGEEVDEIISPNEIDDEEENENMADMKVPNLFGMLNKNKGATPDPVAAAPAPAQVHAPAVVVPALNVPKVEPAAKAEPAPAKAEPKAEPAPIVVAAPAPTAAKDEAVFVDIRKHPKWDTLATIAKSLEIDLEGFITHQEKAYGAALATINDRDSRVLFLHRNLGKFVEEVFNLPELPNA